MLQTRSSVQLQHATACYSSTRPFRSSRSVAPRAAWLANLRPMCPSAISIRQARLLWLLSYEKLRIMD